MSFSSRTYKPFFKAAALYFVAIGFVSLLLCRPVQAVPPEVNLSFLSNFSFTDLPWPATLRSGQLQIKLNDEKVPEWKNLWDKARASARAGNLMQAVEIYQQSLALKPDLDAANWELANILVALGKNKRAQAIMEILHDHNPDRLDYLFGLAVLDLKTGNFVMAADLFSRIYEKKPHNVNALAGAVYGYLRAGRQKPALPLLKDLWGLAPATPGLGYALAFLAYDQGDYKTALSHLSVLAAPDDASPRILLYIARSLEHLGLPARAVSYWQRLLVANPDQVEAHTRLAQYFEEDGQVDKALPHLLFLSHRQPDEAQLLKRIAQCYVGMKQFPQALNYFKAYLLKKPTDTEAARLVVNLQAALGNKTETLVALEHYFDIESHPEKTNLEKAAKLYGEKGLYHQAIAIWRRLLKMTPNDPDILGAMAHNFLAIGKNEEALKVWKKLAKVSPNVVGVYRPMADLLERMGREQELTEVLEAIHEIEPLDQDTMLKLSRIYVKEKHYDKAQRLFNSLAKAGCRQPDFFYWQGILDEERNELIAALKNFKQFLQLVPERADVRVRCLVIAGRLGEEAVVRHYYDILTATAKPLSADLQFKSALAFWNCGNYGEAGRLFKGLIDNLAADPAWPNISNSSRQLAAAAAMQLSAIYQDEELPYEAEQALRYGFALTNDSVEFLPKLFDLSLAVGRVSEAEGWFNHLRRQPKIDFWYLRLREARLRLAQGEGRQAGRIAEALMMDLPGWRAGTAVDQKWFIERLDLADFLRALNPTKAASLCAAVLGRDAKNLRAMVIMASLVSPNQQQPDILSDLDKLTVAERLDYARLAKKIGNPRQMELAAKLVLAKLPDSLMASIIEAQACEMQGKLTQAVRAWVKMAAAYPANSFIVTRAARTTFLTGDLDKALAFSRASGEHTPDMLLLQARILWMQNDWAGSVKLYQQFLEPGVDDLLLKEGKALRVVLPSPKQKKSFLQKISLAPVNRAPLADLLMAPDYFVSPKSLKQRRFMLAAARLFALYRWQDKFSAELLVRKSVRKRAYFMAQKRYESLIAQYPADKSLLFDLAGIYSRLGKLDDEAAIYDELRADDINFPALGEDVLRNRLKRRPRGRAAVGYTEEEGRNGYKDMRLTSQQLAFRASPKTGHEFQVRLARNNYHGINQDGVLRSSRAFAAYQAKVASGLKVNMGGGAESLDRSGADTFLFNMKLSGKLGDKLSAKAFFAQDIVSDTLTSVDRGIYKQDLGAGLSFEPLSRLSLGGDYDHINYSDSNWTISYDLWSSLLLHSEPLFLQVKYKYDFKDSADGTGTGQSPAPGFAPGDHPYWSPKNYWANEVGIYFKHLLSHDNLGRGTPKYYTLEYYLGHDSGGYGFQTAKGSMFIELSPHFMMQAGGELFSSAVYRKKQISISASYRW